ncbi:MAG: tRNA lysidine(34) synthetase TilS [Deltaproteobacteria bacterium]|nr:tRNA lysidine(34) synthetase TilS [Deltaproteobacteria bacterium]
MNQNKTPAKGHFIRLAEKTMSSYGMITQKDAVLVAVSGGPDSVALLYTLADLAIKYELGLGIAHLNHCLRGHESDADEVFVTTLAKKMGIPLYTQTTDIGKECAKTGGNIEETGRDARYKFFSRIASAHGFNRIALGHNRDDNAELILINLLRGAGAKGLGGIPPVRENLIRPLFERSKKEIISFLKQIGVPYSIDSTNNENIYLRNKIRNQLIPELATYNPNIIDTLCRLGNVFREEDDWVEQLVSEYLAKSVIEKAPGNIALSAPSLCSLPPAALRRVIRRAVRHVKSDLRRISFKHIDSAIHLLQTNKKASLDLPGQIRIWKNGEVFGVRHEKKSLRSARMSGRKSEVNYNIMVNKSDAVSSSVWIAEAGTWIFFSRVAVAHLPPVFEKNTITGWINWEKVTFPIRIRNFKPGDRFRPYGPGGTQKVCDFLCNNKVPVEKRAVIPILECSDHIIWVAGLRIDERVKTDSSTRFVLKAEIV